eukprot:GHUV01029646.1.p1 GENE.GHUV01029646.1~~GHUV01029646.1.p1  ORF type:complete len:105 (+),score=1.24 GHUV01029646.1:360-674(+)
MSETLKVSTASSLKALLKPMSFLLYSALAASSATTFHHKLYPAMVRCVITRAPHTSPQILCDSMHYNSNSHPYICDNIDSCVICFWSFGTLNPDCMFLRQLPLL